MPYIHSTLTNDTAYASYVKTGDGSPNKIERQVLIKGGANRATKQLVTPLGAVTSVTDEELEFLEKNELFQQHKKGGFIKVTKWDSNPDRAVHDMTPKDGCAPKTPDDPEYKGKTINVGKPEKKAA